MYILLFLFIVGALLVWYAIETKKKKDAGDFQPPESRPLLIAAIISLLIAEGLITEEQADDFSVDSVEELEDMLLAKEVLTPSQWETLKQQAVEKTDVGGEDFLDGSGFDLIDG